MPSSWTIKWHSFFGGNGRDSFNLIYTSLFGLCLYVLYGFPINCTNTDILGFVSKAALHVRLCKLLWGKIETIILPLSARGYSIYDPGFVFGPWRGQEGEESLT